MSRSDAQGIVMSMAAVTEGPGGREGDSPLQGDVLGALTDPNAYREDSPTKSVEWIQTHLSHVFLTHSRVYKFRKSVDFGFAQLSTRAQRNEDCLREVALNRRLAADVYLGVAPLLASRNGARIGEPREHLAAGAPTPEHCVVMRRLPAGRDAASLLARGELTPAHLDRVASAIARFHEKNALDAVRLFSESEWLTHCNEPVEENFSALEQELRDPCDLRTLRCLARRAQSFARAHARRFESRRHAGRCVDGHGDLRLEHIWFETDTSAPLIIDCVEFNHDLRQCDPASDIAFLAMDLRYRGAQALAERFLRIYASERNDFDLYGLVDYYASYRATVRSKVGAIAETQPEMDAEQRGTARASTRRHLELALRLLDPPPSAALVLVGGAVGTGKSTVADEFAESLGGVVVSSDRVRKHRLGLAPTERAAAGAYEPRAKKAVYGALLSHAEPVIASGRVAILDATFGAQRNRETALARATAWGVPAFFVEVRCAPDVARDRLGRRAAAGGDASDAGPELHEASRAGFEFPAEWPAVARARIRTDAPNWRSEVTRIAECVRGALTTELVPDSSTTRWLEDSGS